MGGWKYVPRLVARPLERALATSPVVVLMGARQTGKTTLVQSEPYLSDRLYLTLDDLDTREQARKSPEDVVKSATRVTLDEVQREPGVLHAVKRAVDSDRPRKTGRFLLTGSANLLLMRRVSETLAGRATYVQLWPLTRSERIGLGACGIWTDLLATPVSGWPKLFESSESQPADWRDEAARGGYPTPALELDGHEARALWFDGYVRTYLERDLQDVAFIRDVVNFRRAMRATCLTIGTVLNQSRLGRDTGIPRATLQRYLDLMESCYQLVRVPAFSVNRTKRLVKSPRVYWSDPALALWLSGSRAALGAHLENLVLSDLLAWRDSLLPAPDVLHWRTSTAQEVDFVIESGSRLLAIEVKASSNPGHRATRGLRAFRQEYDSDGRFAGGLLLNCGKQTRWMSDRILAVPWWKVL
ncbi:MAG: ATP-binding protein [Bryobacterales bacterium]|nr:ATP-binding protein [Bryobacterales bacterium]